MATLAPMNPPARQPLGAISGARLRNLGHVKNKQNGKESPQTFNDIDSENIDPSSFKSSGKPSVYTSKNTTSTTNTMNCFRPARFVLSQATAARASATQLPPLTQAIGSKRKAESDPSASEVELERPLKSSRNSPPPPAGRSPKSKRVGILSRRRVSASPFTRVDPPTFGSTKNGDGLPLSINAALAGTIPSHKLRKPARTKELIAETVLESMPKGWMFAIHTDSKDQEASNLMEHSACTLDISDDETSSSKMFDEENKENIPPQSGMDAPVSNAIAALHASRKHMMTDEPRAPLGELEASDYYAAGCDALSYITIPEDEDLKSNIQKNVEPDGSTTYASANAAVQGVDKDLTWNDLVDMAKPTNKSTGLTPIMSTMTTNAASALARGSLSAIPEDEGNDTKVERGVVAAGNLS
ncbi:hypothetical protein G7Y79_00006g018670 [Physcia stellaris]|nr:hypothetical protein G7Y79_00006g018670 [Physcia stellaris]